MSELPHSRRARPAVRHPAGPPHHDGTPAVPSRRRGTRPAARRHLTAPALLTLLALLAGTAATAGPAGAAPARPSAPVVAEGSTRRDQTPGRPGGWLGQAAPVAVATGAAVALGDAAADLAVALTPPPPPPPPPAPGEVAVFAAMSVLGTPYRYGGTGPGGFDCSGLTGWAWAKAGVRLPRVSGAQMSAGARVGVFDLRPGDLVFYGSGHVGLYAGNGQVVHAPRSGRTVEVVPLQRGGMRPTAFVRPA